MSDKTLRRSKESLLGCPVCGSTEGFILDEVVILKKHVVFFKTDGVIEFQGDGEVGWNTSRTNPENPAPYTCTACAKSFSEPIPIADET